MARILSKSLENHKAQFPKLSAFVGENSILCNYYMQNNKDGIEVYKIKRKMFNFIQLISVKLRKF